MLNKVGRDIPTNIPALEGREVYQGEFAIEPKAHRAGKPVHMSRVGTNKVLASIDEAIEKGSNLHDLADYAVVQINDTHPSMVIPELIRLLTEKHGFDFDEAVAIVSKMVGYTNHTILAEALEKWPLEYLEDSTSAILILSSSSFKRETTHLMGR